MTSSPTHCLLFPVSLVLVDKLFLNWSNYLIKTSLPHPPPAPTSHTEYQDTIMIHYEQTCTISTDFREAFSLVDDQTFLTKIAQPT